MSKLAKKQRTRRSRRSSGIGSIRRFSIDGTIQSEFTRFPHVKKLDVARQELRQTPDFSDWQPGIPFDFERIGLGLGSRVDFSEPPGKLNAPRGHATPE